MAEARLPDGDPVGDRTTALPLERDCLYRACDGAGAADATA